MPVLHDAAPHQPREHLGLQLLVHARPEGNSTRHGCVRWERRGGSRAHHPLFTSSPTPSRTSLSHSPSPFLSHLFHVSLGLPRTPPPGGGPGIPGARGRERGGVRRGAQHRQRVHRVLLRHAQPQALGPVAEERQRPRQGTPRKTYRGPLYTRPRLHRTHLRLCLFFLSLSFLCVPTCLRASSPRSGSRI